MSEEIIFIDTTKNLEFYSDGTSNVSREQLQHLRQENEKLKNINNDLIEEIASGNIDIAILQKENEELKKQLEFSRTHKTVLDAEKNKYHKALEEINKLLWLQINKRGYAEVEEDKMISKLDEVLND